MTPRQQEVLVYLHAFAKQHGMPPTRAEIARHFKFRSANAAADHLAALERAGALRLRPGIARGILLQGAPGVTDLRKAARGRDCTIRLPGICNFNPETSVLAHDRLAGVTGIGQKAPDLCAAIACSCCHDEVDGRTRKIADRNYVKLAFYEGVIRTLAIWVREKLVRW